MNLEEMVRQTKSMLEELLAKYSELQCKISELRKEIEATINQGVVRGTIELKAIPNKSGKIYYYYYLRYRDKGRLKSKYLGTEVPEWVSQGISNARKLRALQKSLKILQNRANKIADIINDIYVKLSEFINNQNF